MFSPRIPPPKSRSIAGTPFRCIPCGKWAVASVYAVCPSCQMAPPTAVRRGAVRDAGAWRRAAAEAERIPARLPLGIFPASGAFFAAAAALTALLIFI